MRNSLMQEISRIHQAFPEAVLLQGLDRFEQRTVDAREIVSPSDKVCEYLFFAEASISRCFYTDRDGTEQTLWMKPERTFITEFKGFTSQSISGFGLQFYEDTTVWRISRQQLLALYQESSDWALFGALLTERLHVTLIDVFVNLLANDATRNYQYIEYAYPRFLQVAPLKDIASMLQLSQVSLSRIRAGTQRKK